MLVYKYLDIYMTVLACTTLYTSFIERYINMTSNLLLKGTGRSPRKQYNYSFSWILLYMKNYNKYFKSHVVSKVALAWLHKPVITLKKEIIQMQL